MTEIRHIVGDWLLYLALKVMPRTVAWEGLTQAAVEYWRELAAEAKK